MDFQNNLSGFDFSEEDIETLNKEIDYISFIAENNITQFDQEKVYKSCYRIFSRMPIPGLVLPNEICVRMRRNEPVIEGKKWKRFSHKDEISYNLNKDLVSLGRFNFDKTPMFYGSVSDHVGAGHCNVVASLECCKNLLDEGNINHHYDFTMGVWNFKSQPLLVNLCNYEPCLRANDPLKEKVAADENYIRTKTKQSVADKIITFWKLISKISCREYVSQNDYRLTSTILTTLLSGYWQREKIKIAGAIYPSVVTEHKGLNIVLTPDQVETNLALDSVMMYRCLRNPTYYHAWQSVPLTTLSKVVNDKYSFTWLAWKIPSVS